MLMGSKGEHGSIKAPSKFVFLYPQISVALGPHQIKDCSATNETSIVTFSPHGEGSGPMGN